MFGIDIHKDNIENKREGACARYLNIKKDFGDKMPSALFIVGDSSKNIKDGEAIVSDKDKLIKDIVFGYGNVKDESIGEGVIKNANRGKEGFNISSIQFAIHYMFENENSLHNFLRNVSECTRVGGYFIGCCYDGKKIFKLLSNKKEGESEQINDKDDNKIWEITKRYVNNEFEDNETSLGYAIDVYQDTIGKYFREYLVNYDYLDRLLTDYGFDLIKQEESSDIGLPNGVVSTGSFEILYTQMIEDIKKNKKLAVTFKQAPEMSLNEKKVSFLNNYFIYRKNRVVNTKDIGIKIERTSIENKESQEDAAIDQDDKKDIVEEKIEQTLVKPKTRKTKITIKK